MKNILFGLLVLTSVISLAQSRLFIFKSKGSGSGKCDILLNGQFGGSLKSGAYIDAKLKSSGRITISISNSSGASNGMPNGITLNTEANIDYYIQLYTNAGYQQLLKKISHYEGKRILSTSNNFNKKNYKITFEEDLKNPLVNREHIAARAITKEKTPLKKEIIELPEIEIIAPEVSDSPFKTEASSFEVKGKLSSNKNIASIRVNGIKTTANDMGYFSAKIPLNYLNNDINIIAFTTEGRFIEKKTAIYLTGRLYFKK